MASYSTTAAIDAYYNGQKAPINAQIETAGNDYQAALARLEQTKKAQDAENYRSYVRQQNEIPGLMRAAGNNGGMVDSAVASLANAYNQARANRAMEFENNRANQDLDYTNRLAQLRAQLAQYDQMANADKAELAAQQAAARARAAAAQSQQRQSATTKRDTSFVDDYEANRYDANRKAGESALANGASTQSATMNMIQPKNGYMSPNYSTGVNALEKASAKVGDWWSDLAQWSRKNLPQI